MKPRDPEEFPFPFRRMEMDVPPCPECGLPDGIRERVMRGQTEIDFWCCPACGASWRERGDASAVAGV